MKTTKEITGAMVWGIEVRSQNSRVYLEALYTAQKVCEAPGLRQHIRVKAATGELHFSSRDKLPITAQEMNDIFEKICERLGVMAVRFYQISQTTTVTIRCEDERKPEAQSSVIERARGEEVAPLIGVRPREEAPNTIRPQPAEASEPSELQKLEKQTKDEQNEAKCRADAAIKNLKETARREKKILKNGHLQRIDAFGEKLKSLEKMCTAAKSFMDEMNRCKAIPIMFLIPDPRGIVKSHLKLFVIFTALAAYRLGFEESKEPLELIINDVGLSDSARNVVRFFIEKNHKTFKIGINAPHRTVPNSELSASMSKIIELAKKGRITLRDIDETPSSLKNQILCELNDTIAGQKKEDTSYKSEHAELERRRDEAISRAQQELNNELMKIEEKFYPLRHIANPIPLRLESQ